MECGYNIYVLVKVVVTVVAVFVIAQQPVHATCAIPYYEDGSLRNAKSCDDCEV